MPNLDALLASAAHGTLRSIIPPVTTAAWTTMMTGCDPPRHGVFDHRYYDAGRRADEGQSLGPDPRPDRLAAALRRRPVVVCLNLPGLYPAAEGPRASSSPAWTRPTSRPPSQSCPEFAARLKAEVPDYSLRYFWKRAPAVARGADRERPPDRRELPRPGRGRAARRPDRPGLVGADGPVPEPRPVPASRLALPERRRDRHRPPRVERRGGRGDPRAGRRDRPALRAGRPPGRGGDGRQRPRLRPLPGPDPRQSDPRRRRRRPAARPARASSAAGRSRRRDRLRLWGRSATTRRPDRRRSTSRSRPSSPSTGSGRSPSPLTRTPPRWSTSTPPRARV